MRRLATGAGVAIASLRAGRTGVRVAFSEPHGPAFLHYQFLRDACPCAQCRDPRTLQRTAHASVTVGALIAASDFAGALHLVHESRALLLAPELARVRASALLIARLDRYERVVGDSLVSSFTVAACTYTAVGRGGGGGDGDDGGDDEDWHLHALVKNILE